MDAFGVSTWDEVLAFFEEGGELAGLWGWLEVLRRAHDCDWVHAKPVREPGWNIPGASSYTFLSMGRIHRDSSTGEIYVDTGLAGKISMVEFAANKLYYILASAVQGEYDFGTRADTMYFHPRLVRDTRPLRERPEDLNGLAQDSISIFLDVGAAVGWWGAGPELAGFVEALQVFMDAQAAIEGWSNYLDRKSNVGYNSDDVLGMVGWVPWLGSVPDLVSVISNATGYRVVWTP